MRILLVNANPVVSHLVSLNIRDNEGVLFDEITGEELIPEKRYDVVFIDEKCCHNDKMRYYVQRVNAGKKILFSTQKTHSIEGIDRVIRKPFLPSEIDEVLQAIVPAAEEGEEEQAGLSVPDMQEESERSMQSISGDGGQILDSGEIEKIKQLLVDEEEEAAEAYGRMTETKKSAEGERKNAPKKKKGSRKSKKKRDIEGRLLEAITKMKTKKIRGLLRGAEMSIVIKFPKEA